MRHEKSTKGEKERSYARPNTFTLANEFDHIPATFTSSFSYFVLVSPDFEALGGPIKNTLYKPDICQFWGTTGHDTI